MNRKRSILHESPNKRMLSDLQTADAERYAIIQLGSIEKC